MGTLLTSLGVVVGGHNHSNGAPEPLPQLFMEPLRLCCVVTWAGDPVRAALGVLPASLWGTQYDQNAQWEFGEVLKEAAVLWQLEG